MKNLTLLILAFSVLIASPANAQWDFEYSYPDVFSAVADDYVVSSANIKTTDEGANKYMNPINNGVPAHITYRFPLNGTITEAYLFAHIATFNFGGGNTGIGSLWGSKDGVNWELLMDAPTPASSTGAYFFDQMLPNSLLGGQAIWIQARLQSSGWNIMAQFSRTATDVPYIPFQFKAKTRPLVLAGNLVQNGSFESPGFGAGNAGQGRQQYISPSVAISNWTLLGNGDVFLHKTPDVGNVANSSYNFAQNGNYYVDLSGGGTAHAVIFQDIPTVPSKQYHLSFYVGAANFTPPAATVNVKVAGITTHLNTTLTPLAPTTNINWLFQTFSFVADSTTTRVSFQDVSPTDDNASFVDNVVLVSDPPIITIEPQSVTATLGDTVAFSVTAEGAGTLRHQWQKDGFDISGATEPTIAFASVKPADIGRYKVRVTDLSSNTVESQEVSLTVTDVDSGIWQGLIAYYPFESSAEDATVFGFDGVSMGALPVADRRGIAAKAYRLNGTSFVDFPQFPTLGGPSSQFTISLWAKAESIGPIFGDYDGTQTVGDEIFAAHIAVDNNPVHSALPNYLSVATRNFPTLPRDRTLFVGTSTFVGSGWRHIAYQMDGVGSCHTFLDGVKVGSLPYNSALNHVQAPHWRAGKTLFAGQNQFFTGSVDDIRIYNRALSEAEVQALYTSEANHPPVAVDDGPLELPLVDFAVIGNDSDPDGSPISVTAVSAASGGTASRKPNGLVSYVPGASFTGTDTFTYALTDGGGLTAVGTVTVRDTTPPTISVPFSVRTTGATTMPDFTSRAEAMDTAGPVNVTQSPAPGSTFPLGSSTVTLMARDLGGNEASASFTIIHHPPQPAHTAITKSGDPVPGAGTINGLPTGAVFTDVGVPAINDAGDIAFIAKWSSTMGPGVGVFAGSPPLLLVKAGDPSPSPDGGGFKTFTDPVLDADGTVAFFATLKGSGIRATTDTVLMTNALGGGLEIIAREGGDVSGVDDAKIRSFKDVSLVGGEVLFTATLTGGAPAVRSANDTAAFRATSGGIEKVVREGDSLNGSTVKAFLLLEVAAGSPGQNRAHRSGQATFLALLADGTQAVAQNANGVVTAVVSSGGSPGGALAITSFRSFGLPSANADEVAFVGNLNLGVGVTKGDAKGVFVGDGNSWQPIARLEKPVPGITGANFKSFLDPVLAQGSESIAFQASFKGKGIGSTADTAIFYRSAGGGLNMVARESATPPGGASALRWKNFVSLALPDGNTGPLFFATLSGSGVNAGNDAGVWAMDSAGAIRLLFREGDTIDGKKLKSFTVLNAIPGSRGVTRSFNAVAEVAWRATFADRTTAVVVTSVP